MAFLDFLLYLYLLSLLGIALYGLMQMQLTFLFWRYRRRYTEEPTTPLPEHIEQYPFVTVQLPIYNELYVVERLLNAVWSIDYPDARWEVQILDDSTDETSGIISRMLKKLYAERPTLRYSHIRRSNRQGFKAGALAEAMPAAKGELIAIFDADFVPQADFLRSVLPILLHEPRRAMVQTRWAHLNAEHSILTRLQAFAFDTHFSIEQWGRSRSGAFINFNGTAGVWRRQAIEQAGGWHTDTITEDLDLSYRAQLAGWQLHYVDHLSTPAELPQAMPAIKGQQYRWNKGGAECARKNLLSVLKAPQVSLFVKLNAMSHLLTSSLFVLILITVVAGAPIYIWHGDATYSGGWVQWTLFSFTIINILAILSFFTSSFFYRQGWSAANLGRFLSHLPLFLCITYGMSLFNSIAVVAGWLGIQTPFVRTPKFGNADDWQKNRYLAARVAPLWWAELAFALVSSAVSLYFWFVQLHISAGIFYTMVAVGFWRVVVAEWAQTRR